MSDWKAKRKADRISDLENDILCMRAQAYEDEKLITAVENEDVTVSAGNENRGCYCGSEVETNSLYLNSSDIFLELEAGTNAKKNAEGATVITLSKLYSTAPKLNFLLKNEGDTLSLVFKGENSLSLAYAALRAATALLHNKQKEIEKIGGRG